MAPPRAVAKPRCLRPAASGAGVTPLSYAMSTSSVTALWYSDTLLARRPPFIRLGGPVFWLLHRIHA